MSSSGTFTMKGFAPDRIWVDDASAQPITDTKGWTITTQSLDKIQGQMVTAKIDYSIYDMQVIDDVAMKTRLINQLCMELLSAKCIEFTKQQNPGMDTVTVRARIYATPDSQVRLIRSATK
jgi:hypothetical protein